MNDKFNFRECIYQICQNYYYHILDLRLILLYLPLFIEKGIAIALVVSRLDHCNSLFHNTAIKDITQLQRFQNCLAKVVTRSVRFTNSKLSALASCPTSYHL